MVQGTEGTVAQRQRSFMLDVDVLDWIKRRSQAEDLRGSQFVRRILRAAMDAEREANDGAAR